VGAEEDGARPRFGGRHGLSRSAAECSQQPCEPYPCIASPAHLQLPHTHKPLREGNLLRLLASLATRSTGSCPRCRTLAVRRGPSHTTFRWAHVTGMASRLHAMASAELCLELNGPCRGLWAINRALPNHCRADPSPTCTSPPTSSGCCLRHAVCHPSRQTVFTTLTTLVSDPPRPLPPLAPWL
jgi:hypothetical protein